MLSRDYRDIVGGFLLTAVGLAYSSFAAVSYNLGTLRNMGPGMFPVALGVVLAVFGIVIAIPAFFRSGSVPEIRRWSPLFVLSGVMAFSITIAPFGLLPAIAAVVIVSSLAELTIRPIRLVLLTATLCLLAWGLFGLLLGLAVPLLRWPF
jgi:hypothetical protein